jgi:prolipoprotein diacylglyceryltransferase
MLSNDMRVLNNFLGRLVRPEVRLFPWHPSAYQVCGYTGLILAIAQGMILAAYGGLSLWILIGVIGVTVLTFFGLVMSTRIIAGEEQIIYYHHEIAIMIMAVIFLKLLNQPLLPYLDITILGIGTFLFCGRVGCLMVGCCHGRPHQWGVCYQKEHADAGFTRHYVGVRLFPIQAVESLWVLFIVIVGMIFVLGKHAPGEALAWYVINYDIGRFIFEFVRGDPDRPYYLGFSEGQWISLILMGVVVWAELAGTLPFHLWHMAATAGIVLIMLAIALIRHFRGVSKHKLLNPRHVGEVAEAVDNITLPTGNAGPVVIPMSCTSLGIQISAGKINEAETSIDHYALSSQKVNMNKKTAEVLANLIIQLKHPSCSKELITQNRGVFHLLIRPLNKSFVGVQGAVFQKSPLAAGGKE